MHFHLPKPLHGWREFAGEVGIIVVGVLLALGAEQVVESLRDRASASETRRYIRGEIEENLSLILERQRTEGCVQRRLREIASYLDSTKQSPRPSWIGAPYDPLTGDLRFKSAQSAGKFFLLPQNEQQDLSIFYVDGDDLNAADTREWYDWAQLRSLASSTKQLTDNEVSRLRQALQDAEAADWLIRLDAVQFVKLAHIEGVASSRRRQQMTNQVPSVCFAMNTPYQRAASQAGTQSVPFSE